MDNIETHNSFDTPAKVILRKGITEEDLLPELSAGQKLKDKFSKNGIKRFLKNNFPAKGDKAKDVIRKIIMNISFIVLIASIAYLIYYYVNYREAVSANDHLIEIYQEYDSLSDVELQQAWSQIKAEYPDVEFPEGMNIAFARLYAINNDIAGRLTIPGTNVDTVVVQTTNNSYYLYKDFYGQESRYGMPFANCTCSLGKDGLSTNTIIYGHNTHDGLMFHQLTNYLELDGYKAAPVVKLDTLYGSSQWKIFAVILTNATTDLDRGNVFNCLYADYDSPEIYDSVLAGIKQRSIINTNVDVNNTDKILSLYTCYQNIFKGGRLIVFARQVRDGESAEVDTTFAAVNTSARYPQAYYDAKGLTNPYYNSSNYDLSWTLTASEATTAAASSDVANTASGDATTVAQATPEVTASPEPAAQGEVFSDD